MKKIFLLAFLFLSAVSLYSQVPGVPVIISPADSATICPPYIFDWNDVPTATSYHIQFSLNSTFTTIIIDEDVNGSQFTVPGGLGNTYCYWHVRASNSYGSSQYTIARRVKAGTLANPSALSSPPNHLTGVPVSGIIFVWNSAPGASAYIFQLSKFPTFDSLIVNDTTPLGSIPLVPNTTYYWRMCSISQPCGAGNWSSVWDFTTIESTLPPPGLLSPCGVNNVPLTPVLDWNDVTGATGYRVQVATTSSFASPIINNIVNNSQYNVTSGLLNYNTTYYWRVASVNGGGIGANSAYCIFTTVASSVINLISSEIPSEYKLYNNYPNPFNPTTKIKYQIIKNGLTTLKVFDILGKEIATLVNEIQKPGTYEIQFSSNQYTNNQIPSGMYFYKISTGDFTDTKRMILIK